MTINFDVTAEFFCNTMPEVELKRTFEAMMYKEEIHKTPGGREYRKVMLYEIPLVEMTDLVVKITNHPSYIPGSIGQEVSKGSEQKNHPIELNRMIELKFEGRVYYVRVCYGDFSGYDVTFYKNSCGFFKIKRQFGASFCTGMTISWVEIKEELTKRVRCSESLPVVDLDKI